MVVLYNTIIEVIPGHPTQFIVSNVCIYKRLSLHRVVRCGGILSPYCSQSVDWGNSSCIQVELLFLLVSYGTVALALCYQSNISIDIIVQLVHSINSRWRCYDLISPLQ